MRFTTIADAKRRTGLSYLGALNSSSKIMKGVKKGIYTYILYLAPAETSGYNVCMFSTKECRAGCLATSGRAKMEAHAGKSVIQDARIKKTRLFFEHNQFFMDWMRAEILNAQLKAERKGFKFSVRLNGTSDIVWEDYRVYDYVNGFGKHIFDVFPNVQFYDYTKHPLRAIHNEIPNYQLTLSYSGKNELLCVKALDRGVNVAVVFDVKKGHDLPPTWNGYTIIDGDLSDYRPGDGDGVVVGLRWKDIADKQASEFVKNSQFVVKV